MDQTKSEMIQRLKERMRDVPLLPDEEDFTTSDDTMFRYLKAFEWKYTDAEAGLLQTVEFRRETQPLRRPCGWCHRQPGFHSMRQVGHDESGRPVVYANFAQAFARKNTADDVVAHVTYLIENAKATMSGGISTWVFIIDCTGMSLSVCRPKVGLKAASLLSSHYPERLGMVVCVNHNPIFHAFWKAIKAFLAPGTVSKMKLLRSEAKIKQAFSTYFSDELSAWLWEEIHLNKTKPLPDSQARFWQGPQAPGEHDPRGCATYVAGLVDPFNPDEADFIPGRRKVHCPHPNIAYPPKTTNGCGLPNGDTFSVDASGSCATVSESESEVRRKGQQAANGNNCTHNADNEEEEEEDVDGTGGDPSSLRVELDEGLTGSDLDSEDGLDSPEMAAKSEVGKLKDRDHNLSQQVRGDSVCSSPSKEVQKAKTTKNSLTNGKVR